MASPRGSTDARRFRAGLTALVAAARFGAALAFAAGRDRGARVDVSWAFTLAEAFAVVVVFEVFLAFVVLVARAMVEEAVFASVGLAVVVAPRRLFGVAGTSAGLVVLVMLVGAGWAALCWAALCWAALCWAALCWAALCWAALCWAALCWAALCGAALCWAALCWAALCWAALCWAALCWAALCWAALCWAALCWDGAWGAALRVGSCAGGWPAGDPFWAPVASARSREATTVRRRTGRASGAPVAVDSFELAALESAAGPDVVA